MDQTEKGDAFRALHHRGAPFVFPNPWDAGSARMMAVKGFEALATTSAGVDHVHGLKSGSAGRNEILANAREIVAATDLPVAIDLEDCFGGDTDTVAETIRLAAETGAVGGSIEDSIFGDPSSFYELDVAVERVKAAVAAAWALPFTFTLTARCEFMLYGHADLAATIERLKAYAEAGADVLFAPGIRTRDEVETVVASVDKPVNVLLGLTNTALDMADMHRFGVARVSIGSGFHTAAMKAASDALDEIANNGTFGFTTGLPKVDTLLGY